MHPHNQHKLRAESSSGSVKLPTKPQKQWSPAASVKKQQGIPARQACKPDSVEDGHSSRRRITACAPATYPKVSVHPTLKPCGSPRWRTGQVRRTVSRAAPFFPSYLVLLRVGFTMPPRVTGGAVRSYRTFSPLPQRLLTPCGGIFSVALAVLQPSRCNPGRYPAHCPAESGLSSPEAVSPTPAAAVQLACCL